MTRVEARRCIVCTCGDMTRVEARRCIVCRCGVMEEDGSKAVHCLQVWRHGRGWKQGGALSAGVAT